MDTANTPANNTASCAGQGCAPGTVGTIQSCGAVAVQGTLTVDVIVNGIPNFECHGIEPGYLTIEKGKLFDGKFALLGDNRALPLPVTIHAVVSKEDIIGRVVFSICQRWPWPSVGIGPDAIVPPAPSASMPKSASRQGSGRHHGVPGRIPLKSISAA